MQRGNSRKGQSAHLANRLDELVEGVTWVGLQLLKSTRVARTGNECE